MSTIRDIHSRWKPIITDKNKIEPESQSHCYLEYAAYWYKFMNENNFNGCWPDRSLGNKRHNNLYFHICTLAFWWGFRRIWKWTKWSFLTFIHFFSIMALALLIEEELQTNSVSAVNWWKEEFPFSLPCMLGMLCNCSTLENHPLFGKRDLGVAWIVPNLRSAQGYDNVQETSTVQNLISIPK